MKEVGMRTFIMIMILIFLITVNMLVYFKDKSKSVLVCNVFFSVIVLVNIVLWAKGLQIKPLLYDMGFIIVILVETFFLFIGAKNKIFLTSVVLVSLLVSGLYFSLNDTYFLKSINGNKCVGVYNSFTGITDTKVYYYKDFNFALMAHKYCCIENYGIVLTGDIDFKSMVPISIEYFDENTGDGTMC